MSILRRFGSCIFLADACILGGRKLSCWCLTTPALPSTIAPLEMASEAHRDEDFGSGSPVDNPGHTLNLNQAQTGATPRIAIQVLWPIAMDLVRELWGAQPGNGVSTRRGHTRGRCPSSKKFRRAHLSIVKLQPGANRRHPAHCYSSTVVDPVRELSGANRRHPAHCYSSTVVYWGGFSGSGFLACDIDEVFRLFFAPTRSPSKVMTPNMITDLVQELWCAQPGGGGGTRPGETGTKKNVQKANLYHELCQKNGARHGY
ncbi:hypothetical protein B0H14DRAFT_2568306 [Mycena olivaceomarginata]|nr:hypothetical protein B0H14DRAFT_2568306 [Mycena olivaceomarginata]